MIEEEEIQTSIVMDIVGSLDNFLDEQATLVRNWTEVGECSVTCVFY